MTIVPCGTVIATMAALGAYTFLTLSVCTTIDPLYLSHTMQCIVLDRIVTAIVEAFGAYDSYA
jgi:hypothetical protein